MNNDPDISFLD